MTTRAMTHGGQARLPALPRPGMALAAAVAAGAAVGALHAADTGELPSAVTQAIGLNTVAADLHLEGHHQHVAAPVAASTTPARDAAADAVPELTKSAHMAAQADKADSAIARFESHIGSSAYENWCERAVENAYGTQGHYASAIQDWHSQKNKHTDWQHAPRGAMVFYNTSSDGHVALSLGDGRVVSSSAHHQVGIVPVGYFQRPLGWAPAPY